MVELQFEPRQSVMSPPTHTLCLLKNYSSYKLFPCYPGCKVPFIMKIIKLVAPEKATRILRNNNEEVTTRRNKFFLHSIERVSLMKMSLKAKILKLMGQRGGNMWTQLLLQTLVTKPLPGKDRLTTEARFPLVWQEQSEVQQSSRPSHPEGFTPSNDLIRQFCS